MENKLLTISEAANYLGVSISYVYKMCSIRGIDFYKIGRSNKFLMEDLNNFIVKNKVFKESKSNYNLRPFVKL
jgi:excisionase family DNA binding protein